MGSRDLLPVFAAIWLAGAIRLGMAVAHEETFGAQLTLTFGMIVLIPVLLFSSRWDACKHERGGRERR